MPRFVIQEHDASSLHYDLRLEMDGVLKVLRRSLEPFGRVEIRRHGDVVSVELALERAVVFSFQIAARSVLIEPSRESNWPPVKLDSLADPLASEMAALVERGAPRDFVDVYAVCQGELATPEKCWMLWEKRERMRGVDIPLRMRSES